MPPIHFTPEPRLPVDPADRPSGGELGLSGERDRRIQRAFQRRRHQEESNPDADEFTPQETEPEEEKET